MAASLYQHQKHVTLDGHVYSLHAYLVSDRFFNTLTDVEKKAVTEGVDKAKKIHRDMTRRAGPFGQEGAVRKRHDGD